MLLRTGLLLCLLLTGISCKRQHPQDDTAASQASASAPIDPALDKQIQSGDPTDFGLGLFDDDERIYNFPPDYVDQQREAYKAELAAEGKSNTFDETVFEVFLSMQFENSAAQNLKDNTDPQTGLGLVSFTGLQVGMKKAVYRTVSNVQTAFWIVKAAVKKWVFGKGSGDFKKDYFEGAVEKKWKDTNYSRFDPMSAVTLDKVQLKDASGAEIKLGPNLGGDKVYLGMLPNTQIIKDLKSQYFKSQNFDIMSIVEGFELKFAMDKSPALKGNTTAPTDLGNGRFLMKVDTGSVDKTLGIDSWTQYSTPDRTMMTANVVRAAIEDLLANMKAGQITYVHCKSGKGRSASVVVGARVAAIMDAAADIAAKKAPPSTVVWDTKTIDAILEEQITAVHDARSEIGISDAQKTNLQKVLYQRAGLI